MKAKWVFAFEEGDGKNKMLLGGKGANLDVFREAATAWEKRQSALRTKLQVQQGWGSFWAGAGPATGSTMQDAARAAAARRTASFLRFKCHTRQDRCSRRASFSLLPRVETA